jgi:hypothetical protein
MRAAERESERARRLIYAGAALMNLGGRAGCIPRAYTGVHFASCCVCASIMCGAGRVLSRTQPFDSARRTPRRQDLYQPQ